MLNLIGKKIFTFYAENFCLSKPMKMYSGESQKVHAWTSDYWHQIHFFLLAKCIGLLLLINEIG